MKKGYFEAELFEIGKWMVVVLPAEESAKLSSRGMVMAEAAIGNSVFQTALEPDGRGSHWFKADKEVINRIRMKQNRTLTLSIREVSEWSDPKIPADIKSALKSSPESQNTWNKITSKARWDWIRWIRATKNPDTRKKRITTACDMLASGKKRPCCFNRNICTVTQVSNNGVLAVPED